MDVDVEQNGLRAWRLPSMAMGRSHLHAELELNLLLAGDAVYETSFGRQALERGRLTLFWGGLPHRAIDVRTPIDVLIVTVPLAAVAGDLRLRQLLRAVIRGGFVVGSEEEGPHDRFLLSRWQRDLEADSSERSREACRAELHGRLTRLAVGIPSEVGQRLVASGAAERVLGALAEHYTDSISVERIADAVGVHPNYAHMAFREAFGISIWEYVTRLRVAHAIRLLKSTDLGVDRVAYESGFGSRSTFYRTFHRLARTSPSEVRTGRFPDQPEQSARWHTLSPHASGSQGSFEPAPARG